MASLTTAAWTRRCGAATFNTFGPRQSTRAVTAAILTQLLAGRKKIKLGRLDTRRDLTFVTDVAKGFMQAGSVPGIEGESFNSERANACRLANYLRWPAALLELRLKPKSIPRRMRPDKSEVLVLESDPSLAASKLGWRPEVGVQEGLQKTADWLRSNIEKYRPDFLYV